MAESFVHLHTHTEYSMLDGAAKIRALLMKAIELKQFAVSCTDHGNVFASYELWKVAAELRALGYDIRGLIGCELYVAPASRHDKKKIYFGAGNKKAAKKGSEDLKDVSGDGAFTHMTMLAQNAQGLRALFELTSRASKEGFYQKPRVDAELVAECLDNWPGAVLIGTTGCPSGAVQTRLRLGQVAEAEEEAGLWQDILGEKNYFLELMDHGNSFEAAARGPLMELARRMNLPLLATNDSHYIEPGQAEMHDALLCQPPGTMVRRVIPQSKAGLARAASLPTLTEEVPIEEIEAGDRVVSWNGKHRRGAIRRSGSLVTEVATREYSGDIIGVRTPTGASSRYTYDHKTIARLDCQLADGNYVVYLMRKDNWFRVGITQYRRRGGGEARVRAGHDLGPMYRLREEQGDEIWILSVHETMDEAREQEAWIGYRYNIPTWTFTKPGMRSAGRKAFYSNLWPRVEDLTDRAKACLADFDRDIRFPFLTKGSLFAVRPQVIHACNLLSGMLVCAPEIDTKYTYDGTGVWQPVEVFRETYSGPVYSMNVEGDHTYVADGIVTHNCVQMGRQLHETDRMKFDGSGYHLRDSAEMRRLFKDLPEACDNTLEIAERVAPDAYDEVFLPRTDLLPKFPVPEGHTEASYLRERVTVSLREEFPDPTGPEGIRADWHDRVLGYEIPVLEKAGYPGYMLMVGDFVGHARGRQIRVGPGRGSAAGSGTSYAMKITTVDPLKHNLFFERFVNPERVSPPDVDVDFPEEHQGYMFKYLEQRWGVDNVCRIQTLGRIKAKAAIKDACRVLGLPFGIGEKMTKLFPKDISGFGADLSCVVDPEHKRYADAEEFRQFLNTDQTERGATGRKPAPPEPGDDRPQNAAWQVYDLARELEGLIRSTGIHACGIVVCGQSLMGLIPLVWSEKYGQWVSGFPNAEVLEPMGLLKVDALALKNLDIITESVRQVADRHGVDPDEIEQALMDLDDPATYEELRSGHTVGLFQVESAGMAKLLQLMRADRFGDISAGLALYRPGPMSADAHTDYALRKTGRQQIKAIHPELQAALQPVLADTYGVFAYQEEIMKAAQTVAGYTLGQADILRKIMGKKKPEQLAKAKPPFFAGMKEQGYSEEAAQALWDVFEPFSAYAFNIAHTVSYGHITYATAWLKTHYPAEYMAAMLTRAEKPEDKAVLLAECRRLGITVLVPDVNESGRSFTPVDDRTLRFGLDAVSGLGSKAIPGIIAGRVAGPYTSFADFLNRIPMETCDKKAVAALIRGGAFDSLGHARRALLQCHEDGVGAHKNVKKAEGYGQFDLFSAVEEVELVAVTIPDVPEWDKDYRLQLEREALGLYVSGHPLDDYAPILAGNRSMTIAELAAAIAVEEDDEGNHRVADPSVKGAVLAGQIVHVHRAIAKSSGKPYAKIMFADLDGQIEVMVFARALRDVGHALVEDARVRLKVSLWERDEGEPATVCVDDIAELDTSLTGAVEGGSRPVQVVTAAEQWSPEVAQQVRKVILAHPGERQLRFTIGSREWVPEGWLITPDVEFLTEIKELLGRNAVTL